MAASGDNDGDAAAAGLVVFRRIPDAEALSLMAVHPADKSGVLRAEWHRWWCSAHVLPE